jgi:tRNA(Arg) A34 adenosine deaminase TadA
MQPHELMALAAAKAEESVVNGWGGPFGAVVARAGEVVATGQNRVLLTGDVTAHAEVEAIRKAISVLNPHSPSISASQVNSATLELVPREPGSHDPAPFRARMLSGLEIYASGFPCPMCMGAIYWARLDALYFACDVTDAARIGFDDSFQYEDFLLPLAQRRIPMTQVGRELGLAAFQKWTAKSDHHPY